CVVDLDGEGIVAACSTPATDGAVVDTEAPAAAEARSVNLDLVLSDHNLRCTTCGKNGRCELQDTAIEAGVVDALCVDYHPPSLLAAAFVDTGEPLPTRVRRVTASPADAVGLDSRGRIETGARADLLVVDPDPTPTVARALVAGRPVYRADRRGQ
ncbi:MAG: amidohydrolase family protein, partial [Natronomonas sp.]|nr:amidohydrolase family protein [Natronomonas sp.]